MNFNSRPSARGDDGADDYQLSAAQISIHAPPRGATRTGHLVTPLNKFQFTPLREGRQHWWFLGHGQEFDFNSRPSARGDVQKGNLQNAHVISIHAPPRGATSVYAVGVFSPCYFNSRPSARGDMILTNMNNKIEKFQFTPLREGRLLRAAKL